MSVHDAHLFLECVQSAPVLQKRLGAAAWKEQVLVQVANELGYPISEQDLQTALDELWASKVRNAAGNG